MASTVLAWVTDLLFSTKITSTARSLGVEVQVVRDLGRLQERLEAGGVGMVLVDLNAESDGIEAIRRLRTMPSPPTTVAYLSHVQTELAAQARAAGADEVLPRSAFSARLPEILGRGGSAAPESR